MSTPLKKAQRTPVMKAVNNSIFTFYPAFNFSRTIKCRPISTVTGKSLKSLQHADERSKCKKMIIREKKYRLDFRMENHHRKYLFSGLHWKRNRRMEDELGPDVLSDWNYWVEVIKKDFVSKLIHNLHAGFEHSSLKLNSKFSDSTTVKSQFHLQSN